MRKSLYIAAAVAVAAAITAGPVAHARAEHQLASPIIPPKLPPQPAPQEVIGAWGCVLMGSAGTAAALAANSVNLLNVVAGGVVTPANPAVLYVGLVGVVFTSFCSLGQQLSPLYIYYFRDTPVPEVNVAKSPSGRVTATVTATTRPILVDDEEVLYPWQTAR